MKNLSIMLKPASALCNLRCKYCFYADVSSKRTVDSCGIMTRETMEKILEQVRGDLEPGDQIRFVFQGGEPTLAGLDYFRCFVETVRRWDPGIRVSYALQTNGILLDDAWCRFLKENSFLVGLSLDILPECHDAVRADPKGKGTYRQVVEAMHRLKTWKVEFNVLCTLTNTIARHPQQVWNRLVDLDISYIQFTPCLGELDSEESTVYALTPKRFASFYIQLFQYWLNDYRKGRYRSIKFFDDAVNLLMFGCPTSCGMNGTCQPQLVVEADGSAYPCDFYCLDDYRLGNLTRQGFLELLQTQTVQTFIHRPHVQPEKCKSCRYQAYCGGNCKRMQKEICCGGSDTYCGYQDFLDHCGRTLSELAGEQRRRMMQKR